MNSLMHKLGLPESLGFHDVYSIDDPSLLEFVPRPAHALLLVFPVSDTYEKFRREEDSGKPEYSGSGPDEEVIWYKQTIGNACGLIGLLATLLKQAIPLTPSKRADLLYESHALEAAHQGAAGGGDTAAPAAEDQVDLHYVCFVKSQEGNLWEMDGRRTGPLKRGQLDAEEDVLSERALDLGVRSFLKREEQAGGGELRFSLIALAQNL
ncbi:cysteine proteinase, partial [Myriangium duriaei CBS 260.36]